MDMKWMNEKSKWDSKKNKNNKSINNTHSLQMSTDNVTQNDTNGKRVNKCVLKEKKEKWMQQQFLQPRNNTNRK